MTNRGKRTRDPSRFSLRVPEEKCHGFSGGITRRAQVMQPLKRFQNRHDICPCRDNGSKRHLESR